MAETTDEAYERGYIAGTRAVWHRLLGMAIGEIGEPGKTAEKYALEREEAVGRLREICAEYGDNDWPDDLHLADVIEKHLGRHLDDAAD